MWHRQMLIVQVVGVALLMVPWIEVSMAKKLEPGYFNHIVYLNGGNDIDAWKMVVLNGKLNNSENYIRTIKINS